MEYSDDFKFSGANSKDELDDITTIELRKFNVNTNSRVIKRIISSRANSLIKGIENKKKVIFFGLGSFRIKKLREYYLERDKLLKENKPIDDLKTKFNISI